MCHLCRWYREASPKLPHRYDSGVLLRIAIDKYMLHAGQYNLQGPSDFTVGDVLYLATVACADAPDGSPFEAESEGLLTATTAMPIQPVDLELFRLCDSSGKSQSAFVEIESLCCPPSNLGRWHQIMHALSQHDAPVIVTRLHDPRALGL